MFNFVNSRMPTPLKQRIAVSVFFYTCGTIFASWASRIPSVKDKFHLNEAELGAILFMLPFGSLVALPIAGWAVSKYGSRNTVFLSTLLYAALLALLGISHSTFLLSLSLFFFGFWGDVVNIAVNTQALGVQEAYSGKPLMASFHGMWSLGALTGAFTGGLFMKAAWDLDTHFALMGALIALVAVYFYFTLVPADKPRDHSQKLFAWPDRALLLLGAICFCCALCEGAMADWSSLYYKQVVNQLNKVSTAGYTAFTLLMATGRLIGDRITEQIGYKGSLLLDSILIACGLSLAIFLPSQWTVIAGFGLVGFGVATIIPIVYSLAGRSKTLAPSVALAAVSTLGFTGFLFGPPIIGFIAHETGLRWALLLVLVLAGVIGVLAGRVRS